MLWACKNCGHFANWHMYPKLTGKVCAHEGCTCKAYKPKRSSVHRPSPGDPGALAVDPRSTPRRRSPARGGSMKEPFQLVVTYSGGSEGTFSLDADNGAKAYEEGLEIVRAIERRKVLVVVKAEVRRIRIEGVQIIPLD